MASAAPAIRAPMLLALPLLLLGALIVGLISMTLVFGATPQSCGTSTAVGSLGPKVPTRLVPIYIEAAARYRLGERGPAILAAINFVETGFGQNLGPSSAGAVGWMQFMPETWAAYGVDGDRDGDEDPNDPQDAIFAAANYLSASGFPKDVYGAIFAYNHADWYVREILHHAKEFSGQAGEVVQVAAGEECESVAAPDERIEKIIDEADRLNDLELTYRYGGSHGQSPTPANGPFDCSSAVSHLLQVAGFNNPTMDTTLLISWGEAGRGRYLTIYVKPYGADAHTFIEFHPGVRPDEERYWGTSGTNPNGGPGWISEDALSAEYRAGFQPRHPPGL